MLHTRETGRGGGPGVAWRAESPSPVMAETKVALAVASYRLLSTVRLESTLKERDEHWIGND